MNSNNQTKYSFLPAFLACLVLIAMFCWSWQEFYVDDAYIGFRCIDNLLNGHGLVFNVGERVESVTNLGWLLIITPFALIFEPHVAGKVAGVLCLIAAACVLTLIGSRLDSTSAERAEAGFIRHLVPILVFTSPAFVYFSQSGMETAFVCFLVGVPFLFKEADANHRKAAFVYALAAIVRPECVMLFPIYLLATYLSDQNKEQNRLDIIKKSILPALALWVLVIAALTLLRYLYYGDIVPNTFYAKSSTIASVMARFHLFLSGKLLNIPSPYSGLFFIVVFFLGTVELARLNQRIFAICLAGSLTGLVFSIYSANDWTLMPRYLAPYSPYCLFVIFAGLNNSELTTKTFSRLFFRIFSAGIFAFLLLNNFIDGHKWLGDSAVNNYPGYVITSKNLQQPVADMKNLLPADAIIATRRIGIIAYVTKCQIFDFIFGLPHSGGVAAIKRQAGITCHDDPAAAFLKELWQSRKPTHFLEDESKVLNMLKTHPGTVEQFEVHGMSYRLLKSYQIGEKENWLLYSRLDK